MAAQHQRRVMDPNHVMQYVQYRDLAARNAAFGHYWATHNGVMDLQDADCLLQLNKSTLEDEFDLRMDLPDDRLCPGIKGRYAYIKYLHNLTDTTNPTCLGDEYDPNRPVNGLDIGVGASCIYPLLGCAVRPNWNFFGTDIDEKSFDYAKSNVDFNNMGDRIRLYFNDPATNFLQRMMPLAELDLVLVPDRYTLDFVMCNPPFYESKEQVDASRAAKQYAPPAICTGSEVEMITAGGEVAFVSKIVRESARLQNNVLWFTSLLGFYDNVSKIRAVLRELDINNWCVTELAPGGRDATKRWVISWSFHGYRPADAIARGIPWSAEDLLRTEFRVGIPPGIDLAALLRRLSALLADGAMWGLQESTWTPAPASNAPGPLPGTPVAFARVIRVGDFFARRMTWTRHGRREAKDLPAGDSGEGPSRKKVRVDEGVDMVMRTRVSVDVGAGSVVVRWVFGFVARPWESWSGKVKKEVGRIFVLMREEGAAGGV